MADNNNLDLTLYIHLQSQSFTPEGIEFNNAEIYLQEMIKDFDRCIFLLEAVEFKFVKFIFDFIKSQSIIVDISEQYNKHLLSIIKKAFDKIQIVFSLEVISEA